MVVACGLSSSAVAHRPEPFLLSNLDHFRCVHQFMRGDTAAVPKRVVDLAHPIAQNMSAIARDVRIDFDHDRRFLFLKDFLNGTHWGRPTVGSVITTRVEGVNAKLPTDVM